MFESPMFSGKDSFGSLAQVVTRLPLLTGEFSQPTKAFASFP